VEEMMAGGQHVPVKDNVVRRVDAFMFGIRHVD
jgi:hypothetical protein